MSKGRLGHGESRVRATSGHSNSPAGEGMGPRVAGAMQRAAGRLTGWRPTRPSTSPGSPP
eukprot:14898091-Alexandrium_andersonii.AAC.1